MNVAVNNQPAPVASKKAFITILSPAYNEAAILKQSLDRICAYMKEMESKYDWEILIVNDGSSDDTPAIIDKYADNHPNVNVFHHTTNKNLGGALTTGFREAKGDYVVVMDIDLSYEENHIDLLMTKMLETGADIVVASPYMKGGKNTAVPRLRLLLSKVVNRMMRFMSPKKLSTYTGMVRAYRKTFLNQLNLKSTTFNINPEILQKAFILRAKIEEVPAHLDWTFQNQKGKTRVSSIRIFSGILQGLMQSFILSPYKFFMYVGLVLFIISSYIITWIFINTFMVMPTIPADVIGIEPRFSAAVSTIFMERPYSFFIGGISLVVALQFIGIGFLSLQNKRYFDELFHINSTNLAQIKQTQD